MPIFEHKCQQCGHKFEKLVFGKEEIKCPQCGSTSLDKLFSTFSVSNKSGHKNFKSCQKGICNMCSTCED
jgi:putative FmdB family regulatory protein